MPEYIFLPVPTAEMNEIAKKFCEGRRSTRIGAPTILRNFYSSGIMKGVHRAFGFGCLTAMSPIDTVYVILHGAGVAGSRFIGAGRNMIKDTERGVEIWKAGPGGEKWKTYGPKELAKMLKDEGLPKSFIKLHLMSCGGGLVGGKDPLYVRSIAERVSQEMKALGYDQIKVTGYLGDIRPGRHGGFTVEAGNGKGGMIVRGESFCVTV